MTVKPKRGRGRPPRLTKCPFCKEVFKAREIRVHLPNCPRRPK